MFRGLEGDMCALCVVFRGDKHGTYDRDSPWSAEGSASPCVCVCGLRGLLVSRSGSIGVRICGSMMVTLGHKAL